MLPYACCSRIHAGRVAALCAIAFVLATGARAANGTFSVRQYGAAGDGRTLDTAAFNTAIAACAGSGGGQVLVPAGRYLTGTIVLKSNVTLLLDAGAEIAGTSDLTEYRGFTPPGSNPLAAIDANWH
ncbi:MAG TPA: glycosyl hydrolase family 28-related protein, partial [Bryobacteraceae bacterium]|nr:glycosyl hydrolase family 28-related protein [Bryobacteraceae bacterium]